MNLTRTQEHRAPEAIAHLIPKLAQLTAGQPTTVELEEALLASKAITRAIFEWLAARYSAQAAAAKACPAIQVNTPAEDAAMDLLEAQAVQRAHVHPTFAPLLAPFKRPA